jgi:hypothetical protein
MSNNTELPEGKATAVVLEIQRLLVNQLAALGSQVL